MTFLRRLHFTTALFAVQLLISAAAAATAFDHAAAIQGLGAADIAAGKKLYARHCVACHGSDGKLAQNPLARRFAGDELKFGADPYSLWKTTSYGNGLMFRWDAVLTEQERYQVVHYIRETFIRQDGSQYAPLDAEYFARLPARAEADARAYASPVRTVSAATGMLDGRMGAKMIYGPAQSHSITFQRDPEDDANAVRFKGTTEKALVVATPGGAVICYDTDRLSVAGVWADRLADTSQSHHTSYKGQRGLAPGGVPTYTDVGAVGWRTHSVHAAAGPDTLVFNGHYLHGGEVLLDYSVSGRRILEHPGAIADGAVFSRTFAIEPGDNPLFCLVGRLPGGRSSIAGTTAALVAGARTLHASLGKVTTDVEFVADSASGLWLHIPAGTAPRHVTLWYAFERPITAPMLPTASDVAALTRGGPRRWPEPVQTTLVSGESIDGYAADEFIIPFANPWGSWMRLTALDFFTDGRMAVSTLSGDVWIVSTGKSDPAKVSWSRFANGLYEPLGLRIIDDVIHVRCRDRIVRLHDLNTSGEADYYESFYNEPGEIGAGYHAFIFELQTDKAGNFYYSKSGRKSPHTSAVVRLSRDGKHAETIAGDLRHPNGMGAGGPHDWVTIADNPSGRAIYNGFSLVQDGASYGYQQPRNTPMLAILPASVDSSSTGQAWSDPNRWGPLGGSILHTSYSQCSMFYVMVQDVPPFPNGFAIRLPFNFKAGLMRSRVNPIDGQVYTVGLKGWDTTAPYDGCLYRIRYTGEPARIIQNVAATRAGLRLTFTCDLDRESVKPGSVTAVREQNKKGEMVPVALAEVTLATPRTLEIAWPEIEAERVEHRTSRDPKTGRVVVSIRMPVVLHVEVKAADGTPLTQTVYATINSLP